MNTKRILVTGGLGFIGSNFIEMALERGYNVTNVDKVTYAARDDISFSKHPNYTFIREDISDLKSLPSGIEYIVNFAAESHVDNSLAANVVFFRSNVQGVYNLLDLIRAKDKKDRPTLIHISTDEVYGDLLQGSAAETDALHPSSPYSATKAAADQLVFGWGRSYGIKYRICRSGNNYGYGQFAEKLIPRTIKLALKDQKMILHGDGSYTREWMQVQDNCEGIFLVMEKGEDGEVYNISTNEEHSNLEVVEIIHDVMGMPKDFYTFVENRPGQDLRYSVNSSKIRALGWKPKHTLREYLPEYIRLCQIRNSTGGGSKAERFFLGLIKGR
ncbi:MAG: rfbB [Parcubacteria group bacterium]|nr:rfbB [Parcubacteria group bacterium]